MRGLRQKKCLMEWEGGLQSLLAMIWSEPLASASAALPRWRGLASDAPKVDAVVSESAPPFTDLDHRNKTNSQIEVGWRRAHGTTGGYSEFSTRPKFLDLSIIDCGLVLH
jgi:hypothetical protein